MKWFKHMTTLYDDPLMVSMKDKHGLEGYGFVVALLESIARSMDGETSECWLEHSIRGWAGVLGIGTLKAKNMMASLHEAVGMSAARGGDHDGMTVAMSGHTCRVECRNLLKAKDDYSRKSGHTEPLSPPRLEEIRLDKTKAKLNPDPERHVESVVSEKKPTGNNGSAAVRSSEPVPIAAIKLRAVDDDSWMAWDLPTKANSFESEPRHGYWRKVQTRLRDKTGSHDWFEARLNEARDRTTGQWMHKYSGPIEGNPAAWLNSQCQAMLKGEWK